MKLRQTNGTEAQIIITVHRTRGRMKLHPTNGTEIPSDDGASREGSYGTAPDGRNQNLNGVMHDNHDYKRDNASVNRRDNPIGRSASPVKGHSMGNTVRSSQSDSLKVIPRTVRTDRSRGWSNLSRERGRGPERAKRAEGPSGQSILTRGPSGQTERSGNASSQNLAIQGSHG